VIIDLIRIWHFSLYKMLNFNFASVYGGTNCVHH